MKLIIICLFVININCAEKEPHHVRKVTLTLQTESNSPDSKQQAEKSSRCAYINNLDPKIKTAIISGVSSIVTALITWLSVQSKCESSS
jgi:hypothetical protein